MSRPYVDLKSENIIAELLAALNKTLGKFTALNGVVGIILNGGLSRGYGDFLSEIDIVIFLDKEFHSENMGFPLGISMVDGYLYDIKAVDFQQECEKKYDSVALWDLSYASVLYDPEGKIEKFISEKLSKGVEISEASGLLWSVYWSYKLAGDIWIHRQDAVQGHFTFNNAIKPLIGALFITNKEYIPHEKWIIHMSKSLSWKPDNWMERLTAAMGTGDFSEESLVARQKYIDGLWSDINKKLCEMSGFNKNLDFVQKGSYESIKILMSKNEYSIDEWKSVSSLDALNYEPMYTIFKRVGNKIVLNKDGLISLKPDDMYEWMYKIANELRHDLENGICVN
jgi:hypothetical protein